jgi:hypothetical protein
MIPAARLKSEGLPPDAAIMKSAGEQSQGQAVLQGFSAQYSQRRISLINWASVKIISLFSLVLLSKKLKYHCA